MLVTEEVSGGFVMSVTRGGMIQSCITNALLLRLVPPRTAAFRAEFAVGVKGVAAIDAVVLPKLLDTPEPFEEPSGDIQIQDRDQRKQDITARNSSESRKELA